MAPLTLLGVAVALAMDAFAVALACGLAVAPLRAGHVLRLAGAFGLFQGLMPLVGWLAGKTIAPVIGPFDHWVALALLGFVGGKMLLGAVRGADEPRPSGDPTRGVSLLVLSVATSIDALAVGLSLAMLGAPILVPAAVIGLVCAVITSAGALLGRRAGDRWGSRVEVLGGVILIAIGVKIVLEHTL